MYNYLLYIHAGYAGGDRTLEEEEEEEEEESLSKADAVRRKHLRISSVFLRNK